VTSPAPDSVLDAEAIPVAVAPDEKTLEVPFHAVPEPVRIEEPTVPVISSLEKLLRHEMLRHRSARGDD
jgi:hypothetical protein